MFLEYCRYVEVNSKFVLVRSVMIESLLFEMNEEYVFIIIFVGVLL